MFNTVKSYANTGMSYWIKADQTHLDSEAEVPPAAPTAVVIFIPYELINKKNEALYLDD